MLVLRDIKMLVGISMLALSHLATAEFTHFVNPDWQRGSKGSAYLEWDSFNNPRTSRLDQPDIGLVNFDHVLLRETTGTGFRTGTENIYSLSEQSYVLSTSTNLIAGPSVIAEKIDVFFQIRTIGGSFDPNTIKLNQQLGNITQLFDGREDGDYGNFRVQEYRVAWQLPTISPLNITWQFDQAHTSLTQIALDVFGNGEVSSIIAFPDLFELHAIPNDPFFNGSSISLNDYINQGNQLVLQKPSALTIASEVPIPTTGYLFISALIGLIRLAKSQ